MNKQCECCLSSNNLIELTEDLARLIVSCFSIEVSTYSFDKTMNFICDVCIEKIKESSEFRSQILISQSRLKELYSSTISNDVGLKKIIKSEPLFKEEIFSDCDIDDNSISKTNSFSIENSNIHENQNESSKHIFKYEFPIEKTPLIQKNPAGESNVPPSEEKTSVNDIMNNSVISMTIKKLVKRSYPGNSSLDTNQMDSEEIDAAIPKKIKKQTCTDCKDEHSESTLERRRFIRSYLMKLNKSALNCELCNNFFATHRLLLLHMEVHYQIYVCDTCDKLFVKKRKLKKHMKNHEENKSPCSICHKLIKPSYMSVHTKNHTDGFYFKCSHCTEKFSTYIVRLKHLNTVHKVDIYKYHCKICPKKFYAPKNLNDHVDRCHLKKLNVSCDLCGLKFFNKTDVNRHMRVHSDEKKHECHICNKKYKRMSHLKEHIAIHNAEKFRCLYCDTEYAYKSYLIRHIKIKHSN